MWVLRGHTHCSRGLRKACSRYRIVHVRVRGCGGVTIGSALVFISEFKEALTLCDLK